MFGSLLGLMMVYITVGVLAWFLYKKYITASPFGLYMSFAIFPAPLSRVFKAWKACESEKYS